LELITGVQQRRLWPVGTLPSQMSVQSAEHAIHAAEFDRSHMGVLIHGSVCRDFLEPATASGVHCHLHLPRSCLAYDVSNACLGLLNGIVQIANMIELGQVRAGLVVGTEGSRQLLEGTIAQLNSDPTMDRQTVKRAMASLTLGSASCAVLLVHRRWSQTGNRLCSATARANTEFHQLCHSGRDEAAAGGMRPLMETDSERLMHEGIATGVETFEAFLADSGWSRADIAKTFCHQVGTTHRQRMFQSLALDTRLDFTTIQWLGNTGSVALPVTMAIGVQEGHVQPGDQVAMLGIGSGIHCLMLGALWQQSRVGTTARVSDASAVHPPHRPPPGCVPRRMSSSSK
jgi:3-oxoacyl-[acyl-carrier-protein] synthase-3